MLDQVQPQQWALDPNAALWLLRSHAQYPSVAGSRTRSQLTQNAAAVLVRQSQGLAARRSDELKPLLLLHSDHKGGARAVQQWRLDAWLLAAAPQRPLVPALGDVLLFLERCLAKEVHSEGGSSGGGSSGGGSPFAKVVGLAPDTYLQAVSGAALVGLGLGAAYLPGSCRLRLSQLSLPQVCGCVHVS